MNAGFIAEPSLYLKFAGGMLTNFRGGLRRDQLVFTHSLQKGLERICSIDSYCEMRFLKLLHTLTVSAKGFHLFHSSHQPDNWSP